MEMTEKLILSLARINLQTKEMYLKATYSHRIKHTTTLTISEISDGKYVVK